MGEGKTKTFLTKGKTKRRTSNGASRWSARKIFVRCTKLVLDVAGFLMEAATKGSGCLQSGNPKADCSKLSPCYTPIMPGPREVPDEPPPFLGTWPRVYAAVLIYLFVIIAICYGFTRALE